MKWHVLTMVFGALAALATFCTSPWSHVVLGILVVIFGGLALRNFQQLKGK